MTAIRDRKSDPDTSQIPWDERAAVGSQRGIPWWGAVIVGFAAALVGSIVDLLVTGSLGVVFQIIYLLGSAAAVAAVRRGSLFGPMVQPPLIMAIIVPIMVVLGSGLPSGSDALATVLAVGTPLINGFPMMAVTTVLTIALGILRMYRERRPDATSTTARGGKDRSPDGRGAAKAASGPDAEPTMKTRPAGRPGERPPRGRPGAGPAGIDDGAAEGSAATAGRLGPRRGGAGPADRSRGPARDVGPREPGSREPTRRSPAREGQQDPRGRGGREGAPRDDRAAGAPPRDQGGQPPPRRRQPAPPDAAERRRRLEAWPDDPIPGPKRPRRRPSSGEQPLPPRKPNPPRRDPDRGGQPPPNRPWEQ